MPKVYTNKVLINNFNNTLASFLSQSSKVEADKKADELIGLLTKYKSDIATFKHSIELQLKRVGKSEKGHISTAFSTKQTALNVSRNTQRALRLMANGYTLVQVMRKQITNQTIKYHGLITYNNNSSMRVVEFEEKDLFNKQLVFLNSSVSKIESLTVRLSYSQTIWDKQFALLNKIDENTFSANWTNREEGLYRKLQEIRTQEHIDPHSVTDGHIFEIVDRVALMRQRANRIVKWYTENELKDMLLQRDNVESIKRADNLDIQNKAMGAQITTIGQVEKWANDLIKLFENFKIEGVEFFKERLIETFTSKEQIADDALGEMENDAIDQAREYIQEGLFKNLTT